MLIKSKSWAASIAGWLVQIPDLDPDSSSLVKSRFQSRPNLTQFTKVPPQYNERFGSIQPRQFREISHNGGSFKKYHEEPRS